ncbi:MAG: hypothetical protein FD175_2330 [Beijerinckiaceae bacterium]|nr:MAG: hypothetical protein FD175_2330 [Beijerinckiaceae bacterium]
MPHGCPVGRGKRDVGSWRDLPKATEDDWTSLDAGSRAIIDKHPKLEKANTARHPGTLGMGNHFLEVRLDQEDRVWSMLHSGSRGVGNVTGTYFIERAKADMRRYFVNLPDEDLAYFPEGTANFDDYVEAVEWVQTFAMMNRRVMMGHAIDAIRKVIEMRLEKLHRVWEGQSREHPRGFDGASGPGNAVSIHVVHENVTEVFVGFGRQGVSSEAGAAGAVREASAYLAGAHPVGSHLADRLLLPLALGAGGRFVTGPLAEHTKTNIDVIRAFLDVSALVVPAQEGGAVRVVIAK